MHFPSGLAEADSGHSDFLMDKNLSDHKTVTLIGNVKLLVAGHIVPGDPRVFPGDLRGNKLVFDARTGMLNLDGEIYPSGMPKYVPCTKNCVHLNN